MKNKTRGVIGTEVLLVLALVGVLAVRAPSGAPGKEHWWQFWRKNPVAQVQKSQAELAAEREKQDAAVAAAKAAASREIAEHKAKIEAEQRAQIGTSHEAVDATGFAIDAAQRKASAGDIPVRELETAKTFNDTARAGLDHALGPVSPERVRELQATVAKLNSELETERAAGRASLGTLQTALDASIRREGDFRAQTAKIETDAAARVSAAEKTREEAVKAKETTAAAALAKEGAWALERDALARRYEQLTFWAKVGGVLVACILAYAAFLLVRVRGLKNLSKDLVALGEHTKSFVPADALPELEKQIRDDWLTVHDGTAKAVAKFKTELRL